jgi:uncharacterized protein (TIGR02246 family)
MYRPYASALASSNSFPDVESTIRGLSQDLCTAFNTGNYDQGAALFAVDGQYMPPHREPTQGPKPIERAMRELGDLGYHDLRYETARVVQSGDMLMETGRYSVAISQTNGTTIAERGKYLRAWRRLGAWLIIAECWNSNLSLGK